MALRYGGTKSKIVLSVGGIVIVTVYIRVDS